MVDPSIVNQDEKQNYANFWRRGAALWIDGFIYSLIIYLPILILFFVLYPHKVGTQLETTNNIVDFLNNTAVNLWGLGVYFTYFGWFDCNHHGQTPGRHCIGIRLTSLDWQPITLKQTLIRQAGKWVSALALNIGYKVQPFTPKKQTWHDTWSQTVVLVDEPRPSWLVWLVNLAGFTGCMGLIGYLIIMMIMPIVLPLL
jgi:uncharacterized RDD family membrane protein YckC